MIRLPKHQALNRCFSTSSKRTEKNRIQLKQLGNILLKGKVGKQGDSNPAASSGKTKALQKKQSRSLDEFVKLYSKELEESSLILGFMSKHDIKIQTSLDEGRQFGSHPSSVALRRHETIARLPDEIDLMKTPWEEIEKIYRALKDLDNDQGVHYKYKKRLSIDTKSLLSIRNKRMTDLCKFARRDQKTQLLALEQALESTYHFNVAGFDRSFAGAPLNGSKNGFKSEKSKTLEIPVELIGDLSPTSTKVRIHKKEVNFMEDDALEETLMPHDIKPNTPEDFLLLEGRPIMIENIEDYRTLDHELESLKTQIEEEIVKMQRMLSSEITRSTIPLFLGLNREIKTNLYLLVSKIPFATKYTGPTFKYALNYFDLIPYYGSLLTTTRHYRHLYRHLFKVVLINLSEQMDSLIRIKYKLSEDRSTFMKKTYNQIHQTVETKLMQLVLKKRLHVPTHYTVFLHKKLTSGSFLRIYWLKRRLRRQNRPRFSLRRCPQVLEIFKSDTID